MNALLASRAARVLALLAAGLAGCAPTAALMTPPPSVKPPPERAEEVTGGLSFSSGGVGTSATYGPWRVKARGLDLAYAGDGTWKGTWNGAPVAFTATQGLVKGPDTLLAVYDRDGVLGVRGTFVGRGVEASLSPRGLKVRVEPGGCSLELTATEAGTLSGPIGCPGTAGRPASAATGTMVLQGEAILVPHVLLPQVAFALLAILP